MIKVKYEMISMQTTLNRVHRNYNGINYESTGTFIEVSPSKNMHSQPTEGAKSSIMCSRLTTGPLFRQPRTNSLFHRLICGLETRNENKSAL